MSDTILGFINTPLNAVDSASCLLGAYSLVLGRSKINNERNKYVNNFGSLISMAYLQELSFLQQGPQPQEVPISMGEADRCKKCCAL